MTARMKIKVADLLKIGFVEHKSVYSNQLVLVVNDSTHTQEYISVMYEPHITYGIIYAVVSICRKYKITGDTDSFQLPVQPYRIKDFKALIGAFKWREADNG